MPRDFDVFNRSGGPISRGARTADCRHGGPAGEGPLEREPAFGRSVLERGRAHADLPVRGRRPHGRYRHRRARGQWRMRGCPLHELLGRDRLSEIAMLRLQPHRQRHALTCVALGALALLACSGPNPDRSAVARIRSPIAYGTADSVHTAVVAVLAPVGTTELEECTGSIVQVTGSTGYVLTAAHCCNTYVPTVVDAATDYTAGEAYLSGGTPAPPIYSVVAGSVYYDAQYAGAGTDHDFCM